jgi:hypothetical protein
LAGGSDARAPSLGRHLLNLNFSHLQVLITSPQLSLRMNPSKEQVKLLKIALKVGTGDIKAATGHF